MEHKYYYSLHNNVCWKYFKTRGWKIVLLQKYLQILNWIKSNHQTPERSTKGKKCWMFYEATIYLKDSSWSLSIILRLDGTLYSVICCMLQIINWRFQYKIFDFTLSQQTISKLFVFILTLKSQHTKTRLKSFVKQEGTFYKGKIIYISIHWLLQYLQLQARQWLMETLFAPKKTSKKLPEWKESEGKLKSRLIPVLSSLGMTTKCGEFLYKVVFIFIKMSGCISLLSSARR